MPRDSSATRERILDAAERLILDRGFAGTPVDAVVDAAGITKGTFFYHYPTKDALGHAVLTRFAAHDQALMDDLVDRSARLSRDPVERLFVMCGLLEEMLEAAEPAQLQGCLYASFCYQAGLVEDGTTSIARDVMRAWRDTLAALLREAVAVQPPAVDVDVEVLADHVNVVLEGAHVFGRLFDDPGALATHLRQFRLFLSLLFPR